MLNNYELVSIADGVMVMGSGQQARWYVIAALQQVGRLSEEGEKERWTMNVRE